MDRTRPPFLQASQLVTNPRVGLATRYGTQNTSQGWLDRLRDDTKTQLLDDLYGCLWLVARKEGSHIDSLHEQLIKRRTIVVTEDAKLHLVWYYDTVYIKPLPPYLLNFDVWGKITSDEGRQQPQYSELFCTAIGFLRSYSLLIKHESDFIIAQKNDLIPKQIQFYRWQVFMQPFREVQDSDVSPRYHYGQLRLSRLNMMTHLVRLTRPFTTAGSVGFVPWDYQEQVWQTAQYFQIYAGPLIFVFAILSLVLSSMQVVLAARDTNTWEAFVKVSWGFSVATMTFTLVPILGVLTVLVLVAVVQGQYALRMEWRRWRSQPGNPNP
jgi:hypothetical protein